MTGRSGPGRVEARPRHAAVRAGEGSPPPVVPRAAAASHAVLRLGPVSLRVARRPLAVATALAVVGALAALVGLMIGDYGVAPAQVFAALSGGSGDPLADYFVAEVRAPRVVVGLLVGAALGTAGAIFQTLSGNALGSPDIIGFTTDAASGALVQIIVLQGDTSATAAGAVIGGLVTAGVVYALAWRGGVTGGRLVLVGIGCSAFLSAANGLLIVKASLVAAQTAAQWLAGSLNAVLWPRALALAIVLAVLLPSAWLLQRPLALIPLGAPTASGLGVPVERVRAALVLIGVALVGVATAATGPIAFVALAAPHLVRRLGRSASPALFGSALMGAVLVVASDVVAQRVFAPTQLAVGVVTGTLGGIYLIVLLAGEWRSRRR